MLQAAKISLLCVAPQDLQVHSLSDSFKSLLITPQEQVFEDGAKRPIRRMFLPYQSALYSNIETKVDQLASLIATNPYLRNNYFYKHSTIIPTGLAEDVPQFPRCISEVKTPLLGIVIVPFI